MYGSKYQWIVANGMSNSWYKDNPRILETYNCTEEQYLQVGDGYITVSRSPLRRDGIRTIANKVIFYNSFIVNF